jgi:hypothetical protein
MKTPYLVLILLAGLICVSPPAAADVKADLMSLERTMWTAWGKKDTETFGRYLDADYRAVIGGEKPVVGKEANVKGLNAASCELRNVSFEDVSVQDLGHDVVLLGYTATQDVICQGKPLPAKVAVTTLWHKVNGKWTNAAYHESPILK